MIASIILLAVVAPAIPTRTPLAVVPITPAKPISRVETTKVDFAPGQIMPRHKHNVPVVCFVTKGSFMSNIGEAGDKPAHVGDVTYEPPGVVVRYFRNASQTEVAQLLCASLAGENDTQLNVMLGDDQSK